MVYSKGIMWLDDCRIPFVDEGDMMKPTIAKRDEFNDYKKTEGRKNIRQGGGFIKESNIKGRFTPNLLVCDDMLNDGIISLSTKSVWKGLSSEKSNKGWQRKSHIELVDGGYNDKGTNSRYYDLDLWFNKMVDEL